MDNAPLAMLKRLDRELLMIWAVAADTYRIAAQRVARFGMVTKSPTQGLPIQNPYLPIMNKQASIIIKIAAELGFTPVARARLAGVGFDITPEFSRSERSAHSTSGDEFERHMARKPIIN